MAHFTDWLWLGGGDTYNFLTRSVLQRRGADGWGRVLLQLSVRSVYRSPHLFISAASYQAPSWLFFLQLVQLLGGFTSVRLPPQLTAAYNVHRPLQDDKLCSISLHTSNDFVQRRKLCRFLDLCVHLA